MNGFRMLWAAVLVATAARPAAAGDWPHWRGPNRNGVVAERSGWEGGTWPAKAAWSARVGTGATSPLIAEGRLYTLGWAEERDTVTCLDAGTGKELWNSGDTITSWNHFSGITVANGRVYIGTWDGMLYAFGVR